MSDDASTGLDVSTAVASLEQLAASVVTGLHARLAALSGVPAEFENLQAALAAESTSLAGLLFQIVLVVALVSGTFVLLRRQIERQYATGSSWRRFFYRSLAALAALVLGFVAAQLLAGSSLPLRTLRIWSVATVVGLLASATLRSILMASRSTESPKRSFHVASLARELSIAIGWAIIGIALIATLPLWSAGPGLGDLVRTCFVAIPAYLLFAGAVLRNKRTMATAVAGPRPRSRLRRRLAKLWPTIVIGFLIVTFLSTQAALTLGAPLPGGAVLFTALIFLLTPHLDALIGNWAQRGLESPDVPIAVAAARQTARFTMLIVIIAMLGTLWATPLAVGLGFDVRSVAHDALGSAVIALVAAFLWNVIGTMTGRALRAERPISDDHEVPEAPRSRLGTLVPLLSGVGKSSILALAVLSILVSIGVNVWPLITGLSVFGLAIAFGSQTLVKDVVSGLFFLIDDAFRFGEYIETTGAKGTVEKISIRSVSLRSSRGSIATVPYGQMGKIQNFSRDWVIEKLSFRVAFDTDVEKIRKIFKKIGQDIAADTELAADLLEPFKSQGIADVEDGTLVIRAKFKAKAGKQSSIRSAALKAVHQAFRENGIQAVPKPLSANPAAAAVA